GEIAAQDGGPVLVPFGGDATTVGRIGLAVQFDATRSEDWTADITLDDLTRPGLAIDTVGLRGTGQIADEGAGAKTVTADLDFTARGLAADDTAVQQAMGEAVGGAARIAWKSGGPVVLSDLTLSGTSFALEGAGQVG